MGRTPEAMETALDAALVDRVRAWLAGGRAGTAWLMGWPGSGMTTMVRHLTRGMEAVWLTSATLRSRAFLRDVCSSPLAVSGKRKVLVLDELDVLLGNEAVMLDVAYVVKHNATIPIVCLLKASRAAANCELSRKAALVVSFPPPTTDAMLDVVRRVAEREGLPADDARLRGLCERAPGDIRHVLQTLRAGAATTRDITMTTADAVACLLGEPQDVRGALALFSADPGGVPTGVFECYWSTTRDVDACRAYLDMASAGDLVDRRISAEHRWELLDVYGALTAAAAAVTLPRCRASLQRYGVAWNKHYATCAKAKGLKHIQQCRASRGLPPLPVGDLALVRGMVGAAVDRRDTEGAARVASAAGLDAAACLGLMRLWGARDYKLSAHNRIKRLLAG